MVEQNQVHQQWLERFIADLDAFAGTVHVQRGDDLFLTAAHNIPPHVVQIVTHVPHGKGMAGVAQVRTGVAFRTLIETVFVAVV